MPNLGTACLLTAEPCPLGGNFGAWGRKRPNRSTNMTDYATDAKTMQNSYSKTNDRVPMWLNADHNVSPPFVQAKIPREPSSILRYAIDDVDCEN